MVSLLPEGALKPCQRGTGDPSSSTSKAAPVTATTRSVWNFRVGPAVQQHLLESYLRVGPALKQHSPEHYLSVGLHYSSPCLNPTSVSGLRCSSTCLLVLLSWSCFAEPHMAVALQWEMAARFHRALSESSTSSSGPQEEV